MSEQDSSTQVFDRPEYDDSAVRTVKVTHLVVGLVFLGIAAIWAINTRADDWGNVTYLVPAMLVGAGVLGLVASVAGSRIRRTAAGQAEPTEATTVVNDGEEHQR